MPELSLAIVTSRFDEMRDFYTVLLRTEPHGDSNYVEFATGVDWRLAICSVDAIGFAAPGAHMPGTNRCVRIELAVADVDAEHARLRSLVTEWIVPPTDWPWGKRATWFRDPDGNLVSLHQPISR